MRLWEVGFAEGREPKDKRKPRPEGKRGGHPPKYGAEFVKVLTTIGSWAAVRPETKFPRLSAPMIRGMTGFLEVNSEYGIKADIGKLLLEASPAEADLLLAGAGRSGNGAEENS